MIPEHLEDIYSLAPLQQGLLFHCLAAPDSTLYVEQLAWTLNGRLDSADYQQAWREAIERHPTLRTGFVWKGLDTPVQAVFRQASLPFREVDWRDLARAEQPGRLAEERTKELRQPFDLSAA